MDFTSIVYPIYEILLQQNNFPTRPTFHMREYQEPTNHTKNRILSQGQLLERDIQVFHIMSKFYEKWIESGLKLLLVDNKIMEISRKNKNGILFEENPENNQKHYCINKTVS